MWVLHSTRPIPSDMNKRRGSSQEKGKSVGHFEQPINNPLVGHAIHRSVVVGAATLRDIGCLHPPHHEKRRASNTSSSSASPSSSPITCTRQPRAASAPRRHALQSSSSHSLVAPSTWRITRVGLSSTLATYVCLRL